MMFPLWIASENLVLPKVGDVRDYLEKFLADDRVIEIKPGAKGAETFQIEVDRDIAAQMNFEHL